MWHGQRHGSLLSSSHCTPHLESPRGSNDPEVADEEKEGSWTVGGGGQSGGQAGGAAARQSTEGWGQDRAAGSLEAAGPGF